MQHVDDLKKVENEIELSEKEISALIDDEQPKDHNVILANLDRKQTEIKEVLQQMTVKLSQIKKLQSVLSKSWSAGECLNQQQIKDLIESTDT